MRDTSNIPQLNLLSDSALLRYNQLGLIPSPSELEEAYLARVQTCLGLKSTLAGEETLPFRADLQKSDEILEEAFALTQHLYDIRPSWLPLFFSNYQLTPWHGGCAWIFQLQEDSPRTAFLQLRQTFEHQKSYLKIYHRSELIAHECAHVGRMTFNQEKFEELLAYRTSHSRITRWLGPLVQSAGESMLFMATLFIVFLLDGFFLLTENYEAYLSAIWLKGIPLILVLLAFARLWQRQRTFKQCLANLIKALGCTKAADHLVYRLADDEIKLFAALAPAEVIAYAKNQSNHSLRWRLLKLAYLKL